MVKTAVYTIAVGNAYAGLALRSVAITRHFNSSLPIYIYYNNSSLIERCREELEQKLDINLIPFQLDVRNSWAINFCKWEVRLPLYERYLWMDADAFMLDKMPEVDMKAPIGICCEPTSNRIVKNTTHWTENTEAAYFIPIEHRKAYYNAGVVLLSKQGVSHFRGWMAAKREEDEEEGFFGTSPYYDETYFNRYILVDHPNKCFVLPSMWDQFYTIRNPNKFNICHLVGFGAKLGFDWMSECQRYVMSLYSVVNPLKGIV